MGIDRKGSGSGEAAGADTDRCGKGFSKAGLSVVALPTLEERADGVNPLNASKIETL